MSADHAPEREEAQPGWGFPIRAVRAGLATIAAALLFALMVITVIDVIGRYGFSSPLPGATEMTEIGLAIAIFAALPIVCLENGHVSVSLMTDALSPRARDAWAAVLALLSAAVLAVVAWRLYEHGAQLASYGEITIFLRLPKGPIATVMAVLTFLAALAYVALAAALIDRSRRRARGSGA